MDEPMGRERILIDTSILIDYFRKTQKEKTLFYKLSIDYDFAISSITEFEFRIGATTTNRAFLELLLSMISVLEFDSECVEKAVEIYRDLKSANQLIPLPDIFIAGTAIGKNIQLATLNRKHFERINGLKLYTELTS